MRKRLMVIWIILSVVFFIFPTILCASGASPQEPPSAITGGAVYHFDEGTGSVAGDSSGAGNDAPITGATFVPGFWGSALHFQGGQLDNLLIPQSVFDGFGNTAYFEAMIRPASYPGYCGGGSAAGTIFRKRAPMNEWDLVLFNDGSLVSHLYDAAHSPDALVAQTRPGAISLNAWTKVVSWYDGLALRIYVNDVLAATTVRAVTLDWFGDYWGTEIGNATWDVGNGCSYAFDGDIDEIRISQAPPVIETARGGATYRLDEGTGFSATDSSGAGNDGTISGAAFVPGYRGSALHFQKEQLDNVEIPRSVFDGFGNTAYFEAMIRPASHPGYCGDGSAAGTIFRKRAPMNEWDLVVYNDGSLVSHLYDASHSPDALVARTEPNIVPANTWKKVVSWYDGMALRIYVDDVLAAATVKPIALDWFGDLWGTHIGNATWDVWNGCHYSFEGDIDEVVIATSPFANRPPAVSAVVAPLSPLQVGSVLSASAGFTDIDGLDTHSAVWNWGDGTETMGEVSELNGSGSVLGTHIYNTPGVYRITATVTDGHGAWGNSTFEYAVVYDPNAGFVTGAGWIDSPAGSYMPDPSVSGKATFGFTSRYQKGATLPSGGTQFKFHAAEVNFASTGYEWLVVSGPQGKFKGEGTINGAGSYGFMLTAVDGQQGGGGGQDKFRIKIWDKLTGQVVYDNQSGASDDSGSSTALGGGNILIKK